MSQAGTKRKIEVSRKSSDKGDDDPEAYSTSDVEVLDERLKLKKMRVAMADAACHSGKAYNLKWNYPLTF